MLANIIKANVLGMLAFVFLLYMLKEEHYSRLTVYIFCVVNILLEWGARMAVFLFLQNMRKKGLNQKQMILVGYSRAAEEYIDRIEANPQWGYVVRGILDDNVPAGTVYKGIKVIGRIANLTVILPAKDVYKRQVKILSIPFHITSNACMISSVFILTSPFS